LDFVGFFVGYYRGIVAGGDVVVWFEGNGLRGNREYGFDILEGSRKDVAGGMIRF